MQAGRDFSRDLVKENAGDSMITVTAYANGIVIGGMSYLVDPNMKMPGERPGTSTGSCAGRGSACCCSRCSLVAR
jgi:hypothetical protein